MHRIKSRRVSHWVRGRARYSAAAGSTKENAEMLHCFCCRSAVAMWQQARGLSHWVRGCARYSAATGSEKENAKMSLCFCCCAAVTMRQHARLADTHEQLPRSIDTTLHYHKSNAQLERQKKHFFKAYPYHTFASAARAGGLCLQ